MRSIEYLRLSSRIRTSSIVRSVFICRLVFVLCIVKIPGRQVAAGHCVVCGACLTERCLSARGLYLSKVNSAILANCISAECFSCASQH
jgi:hypothetical protein